ncbi:MAG: hypothetical protein QXF56_05015 [Candidatus Micrarchaeia archaeon]
MSIAFKQAEQRRTEEEFRELANGIMGMIDSKPDWKEKPKEFLLKVLDRINETKPKLQFPVADEIENRFTLFLENELKNTGKLLASRMENPWNSRILDGQSLKSNPVNLEIEAWVDLSTINKLIQFANRQNIGGLSKLLELPEKDISELVNSFEISSRVEFNKLCKNSKQ